MVVLLVVLASPLATWADSSLWVHMTQHVALIALAAPLIALGAPLPTMLWALPEASRKRSIGWWRWTVTRTAGDRWVVWAVAAVTIQVGALWLWHAPSLYDAAVRNPWVHTLEHLSMLVTAVAMWWVLVGLKRRSRWGQSVILLFLVSLSGIALGAAMAFAGHPWYPVYGTGTSALQDQQLAGVVMWGYGGIAALCSAMALFRVWLALDEAVGPTPGEIPEAPPLPGTVDHVRTGSVPSGSRSRS